MDNLNNENMEQFEVEGLGEQEAKEYHATFQRFWKSYKRAEELEKLIVR